MIFKDYYKILGLESNKVSMTQIKTAYREQAKRYHPDINAKYEERFKDINEAYRILSEPSDKRKYDRTWNRNVGKKREFYQSNRRPRGTLKEEVVNMFFGTPVIKPEVHKETSEPEQGENVETEITISIEDAFYGKNKTIGVKTVEGNLKKFKVQIPPGIQNNEKIRVIGQGKESKNGGKNGDLFIRVKIKNSDKYELIGYDLKSDLYLTPWEAALSTKIKVSGIDEEVNVFVPAGIQSGETIEIPDKGYKNSKGGRGKLILETKIMIPKSPTDEEIKCLKRMSKISTFNPRT